MESENKFGLITNSMKENGKIICQMAMGEKFTLMEMSMKDFGKTEKGKAKEPLNRKMVVCTLENG